MRVLEAPVAVARALGLAAGLLAPKQAEEHHGGRSSWCVVVGCLSVKPLLSCCRLSVSTVVG